MAKHKSHQKTMLGFGGMGGPASSPPEGEPSKEAPKEAAPPAAKPAAPAEDGAEDDKPAARGALLGGKPVGRKRGGALLPSRKGGALLGASKTKVGGSSGAAGARKPDEDADDDAKADKPTVPKMRAIRPVGAGKTKIGGSGLSAGADLLNKLSSAPPTAASNKAKADDLDWGGDDAEDDAAAEPEAAPAEPVEAIGIIPVLDIGEPASPAQDPVEAPVEEESDGLGLPAGAVIDARAEAQKEPPADGEAGAGAEDGAAAAERPSGPRGSTPDLDDLFADLPLEDAGETPAPVAPLPAPVDEPASVIEPPMVKSGSALWLIGAGGAVAIGGLAAFFLLGSGDETTAATPEPTASAVTTATTAAAAAEPSATASATASASASAAASASASAAAKASAAPMAQPPPTKPPAARPPWWKREDIYE